MKDTLIQIQVLYEIAMSIGTRLDMRFMLQKSLGTYLRKLSCAAGAVLMGKMSNKVLRFEKIFAIPRAIDKNPIYQAAMDMLPQQIPIDEIGSHFNKLPYVGSHDDQFFHVMELPRFGLLMLFKQGSPLDHPLIQSLSPLNAKLASACQSCRQKERIESIARDLKNEIKERQKAKIALAASHEQLENILDSLEAMVYVADIDTHEIIFTNHYMKRLYGENLLGRSCYEVIRGGSEKCPHCQSNGLVNDNGKPDGLLAWEEFNPKLSRWFMHYVRAIPWRDGRLVRLQISTDVTRLKELEQERVEAAHREQILRLESLGTLAGGVAHEFNNLLMGIMGSVSLMKFDITAGHPFYPNLDRIETSAREAAVLTEKLLGYAQKGRYQSQHLDLNAIVQDLAKQISNTNQNIGVKLVLDKKLDMIEADQRQIEHALLNLLTNACDAMSDGGNLVIATTNATLKDIEGLSFTPQAESYIRITIQDSGSGMSEHTKERIFEPFYTTKNEATGGAGLGMAATYGIIKGHQGFIGVESALGKGSKFMVWLPALPETASFQGSIESSGKEASFSKKTILLIDDESVHRELGEQILVHLGHKVITTESAAEAIDIFRENRKTIDLIILDVIMPGSSCDEIYSQFKTIDSNVKILISNEFSAHDKARSMLVKGADDFLQKPFTLKDFRFKLERVLQNL